jgi:glycosyltransferase involved in cell wall biosynthesis
MRIGIDCRKIADYGIGTYIRGLLHALVKLGSDEHVAFGGSGIAVSLPSGVEHVVVDAPHYSIRELLTMGRAVDGARLDLFHAPHYVVPWMRTPYIVTIHDLIHLRHRNPVARAYAWAMIRRAVRNSRRVLTVSNAVAEQIRRRFGGEIVVAPNGVDAIFNAAGPRAGGHYFLYVGNDKRHKNVGRLVDAFAFVRRQEPVNLVLAGADFKRFATRDGVLLAGFVPQEQLASLYRGAIALVLPSLDEGFGLPAAEAMASGTAVITSTGQALMELTADAAMHVPARSVATIADAMLRMARDASMRTMLIDRARRRIADFTWERCARLTRDAYRAAIRA